MLFDMCGNQIHPTPEQPLTTNKEGINVSEFFTKGMPTEVLAILHALDQNRFSCIKEVIASINRSSGHTYRVSIRLKKSFFTRRTYEYALVLDFLDNHVFESVRRVYQKPKPINIAQAIG
jgi:hypothetical protein